MRSIDLFSGIGGMALGLRFSCRPAAYCEIDDWCVAHLQRRIESGDLPEAPIHRDVRDMKSIPDVDLITAGFPCQDLSSAGKGAGIRGSRSGLFFEVVRLASLNKTSAIFLENSPLIRTRGLDVVVDTLDQAGYDAMWMMWQASWSGAPHERKRWWCLAVNRDNPGLFEAVRSTYDRMAENKAVIPVKKGMPANGVMIDGFTHALSNPPHDPNPDVLWPTPHANCHTGPGHQGRQGGLNLQTKVGGLLNPDWVEWMMGYPEGWTSKGETDRFKGWAKERDVPRTLPPGTKGRTNRLKGLGNSVVPYQVQDAWDLLCNGWSQ